MKMSFNIPVPEKFWTNEKMDWFRGPHCSKVPWGKHGNKKAKEKLAREFNLFFDCDKSVNAIYLHYMGANSLHNGIKRLGVTPDYRRKIKTLGITGVQIRQRGFDE
jgi:hypothetical protein